jgi:hypothetical protein
MPLRDMMAEPIPTELLNYRITASSYTDELAPDDEPSSFATHLPFEVRQGDLLVARIHALLLRVRLADDNGVSPAELFDSVDQDLHELYCAIFDQETESIRGDLAGASDFRDVLYIESVKVIPSRRGKKLALYAVERLRDVFGEGCAVIALKAHPLTLEKSKYQDAINHEVFATPFEARGDAARAKLRTYWSQIGFERVGDTDFMVFDMNDE